MDDQKLQKIQDEVIRAVQKGEFPHARLLINKAVESGEKNENIRELLEKEAGCGKAASAHANGGPAEKPG